MGAFRDKPAYLYVAVTLLGVYIILTLVSASSLPLKVRQAEFVSEIGWARVVTNQRTS